MPKRMIIDGKRYAATLLPFFRGLAANKKRRDAFVRNPAGALQKAGLFGTSADVSQANRLVFSLITNKGFIKWARANHKKLLGLMGKDLSIGEAQRAKLYEECLSAMMKYADRELWVSLVGDLSGPSKQLAGTAKSNIWYWYYCVVWLWGVAAMAVVPILIIGIVDQEYPVDVAELLHIADVLAEEGVNKDLVKYASELRRSKKLADPRARFDR